MQTRKIKGGITPKKSKSNKSKKKSSSNKSKKYPNPPFSTLIFDNPLFESRTKLKEKYTSLIQKFEHLNEPYNSLTPKIEKIKKLSGNLHGPYGEINQPKNTKYIPEVIEEIQKRYANIKNQINNDIDNKFIEIKQEVEYINTYINKDYENKTIFQNETVVKGIIKNIDKMDKEIDVLHNKIASLHNDIDNLKIEIDNLNTDIQSAKKEVIEKETHAKQREKEEIQRKKEENDAKKRLQQEQEKKRLQKEGEKSREKSKERSPVKSQEKSPEKIPSISPNFHLYHTNFITNPTGEDLVKLNTKLNNISNKIFDVIGVFTKKYPHRVILKGGKAIQVLASTILPQGVDQKKYAYTTNDIDVIVIPSKSHDKSKEITHKLVSGDTSEEITKEMIEKITNMFPQYPENVISGENNQIVNGKPVNTMKIVYQFTEKEPQLYNNHVITQLNELFIKQGKPEINYNPHGYKGGESLLDVTYSETETIDFYKDKNWHDCHKINDFQEICSQSIESMLYERLYYINKYSKQTELAVTEKLFLKKIKRSFLYLLFLYTYRMRPSPKNVDTIYSQVYSIQNYSEGNPMYIVLYDLIQKYPDEDKKMTFNNVFNKVILPNLVGNEKLKKLENLENLEKLEKLKKIRDELINFNKNNKLNADIQPKFKKLIDNYYDHNYLITNKAFVEVGIKDKMLKDEFNQIFDIYYK